MTSSVLRVPFHSSQLSSTPKADANADPDAKANAEGVTAAEDKQALIHVCSQRNDSLDLLLEGTEGTAPFVGHVTPASAKAARVKNSPLDPREWEHLLKALLLPPLPSDPITKSRKTTDPSTESVRLSPSPSLDILAGVRLTAQIRGNVLSLRIFQSETPDHPKLTPKTGHQRELGTLELKRDDAYEIDTLAWLSTAVERSEVLAKSNARLAKDASEQRRAVRALENQLEELVAARQQHEDVLLARCCVLLNEKKRKIRDLQRLLAAGPTDSETAAEIRQARRPDTAGSGNKKRRQSDASAISAESDFEFVDEASPGIEDGTPDRSEHDSPTSSTGAGAEDNDTTDGSEPDSPKPFASKHGTKTLSSRTTSQKASTRKTGPSKPANPPRSSPPPRRELPFNRSQQQRAGQKASNGTASAETDPSMKGSIGEKAQRQDTTHKQTTSTARHDTRGFRMHSQVDSGHENKTNDDEGNKNDDDDETSDDEL